MEWINGLNLWRGRGNVFGANFFNGGIEQFSGWLINDWYSHSFQLNFNFKLSLNIQSISTQNLTGVMHTNCCVLDLETGMKESIESQFFNTSTRVGPSAFSKYENYQIVYNVNWLIHYLEWLQPELWMVWRIFSWACLGTHSKHLHLFALQSCVV